MSQRRILVTSALPYANGPIHVGHLVEYLQTDIWVRFQNLRGNRALYLCADDTHGTAIMIRARKEGRSEEEVIAEAQQEHESDFADFQIHFDNYGSTNSEENRVLCGEIWSKIREAGLVKEKEVEQLFDPEAGTFLADRFVRGTCPTCGATDQPGDNCSKCGTTYSPADLIDPKSTLSGAKPELRNATHLFIELEQLHSFLDEWTQSGEHLQPEIANYLKGHFLGTAEKPLELRDWDISRPAPYFGFEIPDSPGNYWYVWFDAPIGYVASTKQWCDANGEKLADWWQSDDCEIHHFIGKDITYFHTLFWPGMLKTAGFSLPEKVHIHGFLTVDGEKMSKSKGTLVSARTYLNHLDPTYLRYYYASKLSSAVDDFDLSLEEFATKVNTDLVGKVVNLASRTAKFVQKTGLSDEYPEDGGLFAEAAAAGEAIAEAYERTDYSQAMRLIMALADKANAFVTKIEPWQVRKQKEINYAYFQANLALAQDDPDVSAFWEGVANKSQNKSAVECTPTDSVLQDICTVALNLFRQIVVYLQPVLPRLAEQAGELFGEEISSWDQSQKPLVGTPIAKFKHLLNRVEPEKVQAMMEESKAEAAEAAEESTTENPLAEVLAKWNDGPEALEAEPLADECVFDDFMKLDLRVARVVEANHVEGADKLLQLTLSLGGDEQRNVFAGIKKAYEPDELVGRLVMYVANLAPRKMKFGVSTGMVAASGLGGEDIYLLSPDEGAKPGQRVH